MFDDNSLSSGAAAGPMTSIETVTTRHDFFYFGINRCNSVEFTPIYRNNFRLSLPIL